MRSMVLLVILAVVISVMTVSLALAQEDDPVTPPEGDRGEARYLPEQVCPAAQVPSSTAEKRGSNADVIYSLGEVAPVPSMGPCVLVTPEFTPKETK